MSILIATLGFFAALAFAFLVIASTVLAHMPRIRMIFAAEFGKARGSRIARVHRPLCSAVTLRPAPLRQAGPLRAVA